ncbi:MAG: hypothetical protein ACXWFJ_06485, partial [Candidatus Aminicenantales bacterium]
MKKTVVLIACLGLLAIPSALSALQPEDWENPAVLHVGTEAPRPADRPLDFWKPAVDVSGWAETPVPSNWMFQG